jgi:hypothetical protein
VSLCVVEAVEVSLDVTVPLWVVVALDEAVLLAVDDWVTL